MMNKKMIRIIAIALVVAMVVTAFIGIIAR